MSSSQNQIPRRSVLYIPGANARAMEKARTLGCDAIIFDLEDAVAADAKDSARNQVAQVVGRGGYGYRELVVRVNGLETPWGAEDVQTAARLPVQALLFPKVESAAQVDAIQAAVDSAGGAGIPLWLMIETPRGVLDGVHLDFRNTESFRDVCEQGRAMGFDGKTLIHPAQVEIANDVFGYSEADVADTLAARA